MKLFRSRKRMPESKLSIMEKAGKRKRIEAKKMELKRAEQEIVDMIEKSSSLPLNELAYYARHIDDLIRKRDQIIFEMKKLIQLDRYSSRKRP